MGAAPTDFEWPHWVFEAIVSFLSAVGGLVVGAWKSGRRSAQDEQRIRDEASEELEKFATEVRADMKALAKATEDRFDLTIDQFKETLLGMRQQMADKALDNERRFASLVPKDEFKDFRNEYREDMRDIKAAIGAIDHRNR